MEWLRLSLLVLVFFFVEIHGQRDKERATSDGLKLVCYYSNWAVYRPGLAKFTPQNINPYLCTHLIYAFGILSHEFELTSFDPYNDIEQGNYKTFVGLKAYNPDLRTLISVGGWSEGSKKFSKLVESDQLRQKFIRSVLNFVRLHGFDGLDLDWEYPTFREGGNSTDKKGYAQLIKELRLAIDTERVPPEKNRLILSVAVPATKNYIDNGFDVPVIAKNADFLNLLTYDYHNAYEPAVQHHAPLFPLQNTDGQDVLNVEWTVNYYLQLGCPKEKMVVGIPMYGRSYTLANPIGSTGLGAPSEGPGEEGHATRERGYMAFYEVCQRVKDEEWEVETPYPQLMGPYAFKGNQWVGFDDEEMISLKARYILDQGLGGAMVWTLDNDDFRGICTDEQSPLVNTLRTALLYSNVIEGSSSQQLVARSAGPDTPPASIVFDNSGQRNDGSTAPARRNTLRRLVQNRQTARRNRHDRPTGRHVNNDQKSENSFTTPVPPTTPDPGFTFECKDEGFFNNPKDCKKYFWCLDSGPANLGVVAHAFTCPSGLYFNAATESCDYPENVVCRNKPKGEAVIAPQSTRLARPRGRGITAPTTPKTTTTPLPIVEDDEEEYDDDEEEEEDGVTPVAPNKLETRKGDEASGGENVAELLRLLQAIGGVDKLQSLLGSHGSSNQNLQSQSLPNYSAPRRTTASDLRLTSTQKPDFESGFNRQADTKLEPEEPSPTLQVPRRPQYVAEHSRVSSDEPLFNYQEPPRKLDNEDDTHDDDPDFPFKYRVPTRDQDAVSGVEYVEDEDGDTADGLYEAPPIRQTPKHIPDVPNVNETPLVEPGTGQRGNYRAPIRVQVVRIPNSSTNDNIPATGVRRRMRVRVRPGGGRIVDDAPAQPHQGRAISRDEHMSAAAAIPAQPHQGQAVSRNEHTAAFVQPHQGRAISRDEHKSAAAAARAVLVHDPNIAFHARNEGEPRVTVRRKPGGHNFNNGTGVSRVVARSRRPGGDNLLNQGHNPQPEGNYIAVRRVPASTSKPQTTHQTNPTRPSTIPSTREPSITVRAGYQPPLNKPSDTVEYKKQDEALTITKEDVSKIDDYDDEYEEYDDYEDEETTQAPTTTTTKQTTTTTTTTTKRPQRSRSNSRPLSSRRNRFSTAVPASVTQSTTIRSTSTSRTSSKPTQSRTRTSSTARPHTTVGDDDGDEIGVIVRSDDDVECNKRGVFIHPTECSKFVVCAPSSRSVQTLRGRVLFCPANQIYLKDSGRCMKGDRNKCEKL